VSCHVEESIAEESRCHVPDKVAEGVSMSACAAADMLACEDLPCIAYSVVPDVLHVGESIAEVSSCYDPDKVAEGVSMTACAAAADMLACAVLLPSVVSAVAGADIVAAVGNQLQTSMQPMIEAQANFGMQLSRLENAANCAEARVNDVEVKLAELAITLRVGARASEFVAASVASPLAHSKVTISDACLAKDSSSMFGAAASPFSAAAAEGLQNSESYAKVPKEISAKAKPKNKGKTHVVNKLAPSAITEVAWEVLQRSEQIACLEQTLGGSIAKVPDWELDIHLPRGWSLSQTELICIFGDHLYG
jgi:hypothetical protein